jgi:hypothetical protein
MTRLLLPFVVIALTGLFAAGCKQGLGDRCQVQSDCDDGLLCVLPAGGTPQSGGTCQMPTSLIGDMATPPADLAGTPPVDMATGGGGD